MAIDHYEPIAAINVAVGDTMPIVRTLGGFSKHEGRAQRVTYKQAVAMYAVGAAIYTPDSERSLYPELWRVQPVHETSQLWFILVEPD